MDTIICFLRGLNMTSHNRITMPELILLFKKMGFSDSQTYIQSGNVIFQRPASMTLHEIRSTIEAAMSKRFGHQVCAVVRTAEEIKNAVSRNPFLSEKNFDPSKMAVLFLTEKPDESQVAKTSDINFPPDKFLISGSEIFIYCPDGFGRSKIYTNFFEKRMKVTGTGRNWNTITSILKIADKI